MSTTFSVNSSDIVNAALRTLGVLGSGETASAEDLTNGIQALNIMIKNWIIDGAKLWKIEDIVVQTIPGQATYTIGPTASGAGAVVADRPLKITDAFLRDISTVSSSVVISTITGNAISGQAVAGQAIAGQNTPVNPIVTSTKANNDVTLQMISRQEYDLLGNKFTLGIPNQLYYDPQLSNGILYAYNVPIDNTHEFHLQCLMPISDIIGNTSTFDFPQEWYLPLKWCLADELSLEYGASQITVQMVAQKANMYKEKAIDFSVEEASTFFQPTPRFGRQ